MNKKYFLKLAIALLANVATSQLFAADLLDVWKSAQRKDPSYITSQYEQMAGEKRRDQADSMFKPNIFLSAFKSSLAPWWIPFGFSPEKKSTSTFATFPSPNSR